MESEQNDSGAACDFSENSSSLLCPPGMGKRGEMMQKGAVKNECESLFLRSFLSADTPRFLDKIVRVERERKKKDISGVEEGWRGKKKIERGGGGEADGKKDRLAAKEEDAAAANERDGTKRRDYSLALEIGGSAGAPWGGMGVEVPK
ncbi:hypothetical protein HNY73_022298 [Argiope bruennichi]|uniref:Uncharacterized protein n=1 Tax=Argiope bruennichi TaxID=94029 RepID=A0A8T0E1S0_ARGBR|nr:hypothetical protein HNY73_022298 [Argiope bruennichi]